MINNKKLIICTPSGREKSLRTLANYILRAREVVDEWHLWVNTTDASDLAYIESLEKKYSFVQLKRVEPTHSMEPIMRQWNLHLFFRYCQDPEAVYIRIDDDICWIEDGAIKRLAEHRLENPEPFIIFGNVLNNSLMSAVQYDMGNLQTTLGKPNYETFNDISLKNGDFFSQIHQEILWSIETGTMGRYKFKEHVLSGYEHHSVTVSSFLGSRALQLEGKMDPNDEVDMNISIPRKLGVFNEVYGQALFVHYQYYYQKEDLKRKGLNENMFMEEYYNLSKLKK